MWEYSKATIQFKDNKKDVHLINDDVTVEREITQKLCKDYMEVDA